MTTGFATAVHIKILDLYYVEINVYTFLKKCTTAAVLKNFLKKLNENLLIENEKRTSQCLKKSTIIQWEYLMDLKNKE